ncbi:hypothetical protein ACIP9C_22205 [Lysinibacillus sp. NPDC093210]|uniref:hypothetical protein n=1 Tax=Lysinibacillus sp. NPDC093210 TaxID=3364133 RepID=UPI0037FE8398
MSRRNYTIGKRLHYGSLLLMIYVFLVGCGDPIIDIEEANSYHWQKHMNENEFEQLKQGMSYMEVVEIAGGGASEMIRNNYYQWNDEILLTQAYIVQFKDDKLVGKEVIAVKGYSTRE